jgi:hypothetical protein
LFDHLLTPFSDSIMQRGIYVNHHGKYRTSVEERGRERERERERERGRERRERERGRGREREREGESGRGKERGGQERYPSASCASRSALCSIKQATT